MIRRKANIITAILLLLSVCSRAQHKYSALLDTVKTTGFYVFPITSELSSYLKPDLSDLRISDSKNQPVPFIIDIPFGKKAIEPILFDQKIVSKETKDEKTILTIANGLGNEIADFVIKLKSAAAERVASLSGSDDNIHWFVILDSLLLHQSVEYDASSHSQRINFPRSNYKYYRFTIDNGKKQPLNILEAASTGTYPYDTHDYIITNPEPAFSQRDSAGYSLITITNKRPFHISKIHLSVAGPWLYKREAKLFTEIKPGLALMWDSHSYGDFTISSDEFSGYAIHFLQSQVFYLLIKNGDNPALKITAVGTEQIKRSVIAQLERGGVYSLLLDNPQATAPNYDLQHFREKITAITSISTGKITALPLTQTAAPKKQVANWWIWPAILLIVLLLAVLVWKLTTDMKKGQ
jgi:hypothetical protein